MRTLVDTAFAGSKAVSFLLGALVLVLAVTVFVSGVKVDEIFNWSARIFGGFFLAVLAGLVFVSFLAMTRVVGRPADAPGVRSWYETGLQSAGAVATLALTYTLLGISLGIGSLSAHELRPDTIQEVIRGLTENFSMAFMTTVIGLPLSAALRAVLMVMLSRAEERAGQSNRGVSTCVS